MPESKKQPVYHVVFVSLKYKSFEEAKAKAPDQIAAHLARSRELHQQGSLLMSGAFLDKTGEALSTMAVLSSRSAAEEYIHGDPFFKNGMISFFFSSRRRHTSWTGDWSSDVCSSD